MEQKIKFQSIEKLDADEAKKTAVLIREDRAKYAFEIGQHKKAIAELEVAELQCDLILADLDRRVVGVDYPEDSSDSKSQSGNPAENK